MSGPRSVVGDVVSVAAISMSQIGSAISLAVLIFVDTSASALPRAIGSFVLGGAIACALIAWRSRIPIVISGAQDTAAVVLVAVAAAVAADSTGDPAMDVIVLMALSALVTGVAMIALGRLGLSNVVRYLPTTVVAAFIAGTGWLLFKGGLDIMVSRELGRDDLGFLLEADTLALWTPGVALGLGTTLLGRSRRLPASAASFAVLAAVAVFFLVIATVSSLDGAEAGGWLIGPFPESQGVQLITPAEIGNASWGAFGSAGPAIVAVVLVSVVGILLNLSGFEMINRARIDLDAELTTAGIGNVLIAPFGGVVSYHLLGDTGLARSLGARSRSVAYGAAAVGVAVALGGTELIGYLPRFVAGGLLVGVGSALLWNWAHDLRASGSTTERLLNVLIVIVIAVVGILEGIGFGVLAACAIFVFRYSRVDPVRHETSGKELSSRVDRGQIDSQRLAQTAEQVAIYRLQGYLFFGTTAGLADRVRTRFDEPDADLACLVIDFGHVTGVDPSAFSALRRLSEASADAGAVMMWSTMSHRIRSDFEQSEPGALERAQVFDDLDLALEAAEELLLDHTDPPKNPVAAIQAELGLSLDLLESFEKSIHEPGSRIVEQGDHTDAVSIVLRGTSTAWHVSPDGRSNRLRRFSDGAVIGEIGFVIGGGRTADVIADTQVVLISLTRERYERLRSTRPELALELQSYLLANLANRLAAANISLASAMR